MSLPDIIFFVISKIQFFGTIISASAYKFIKDDFVIKFPSVYMTVSISVERYVAIFYPLVYKVINISCT